MFEQQMRRMLLARSVVMLACLAGLALALWQVSSSPQAIAGPLPRLTFQSPMPGLNLVKTADQSAPRPGDTLTYTLSYSNTSTSMQATNVRLYDFLPAGVSVLSTNPPAAQNQDGALLFTVPALNPGAGGSVTIRAQVLEGYAQLYNHALVTADGAVPAPASLLTSVTQQPSDRLRLVKQGPFAVLMNRELVYTLRCDNLGSASLDAVTVADVLPSGVTFNAASPLPDSVSTPPLLRWSLGSLGPGMNKTIIVTVTSPSQTGVIVNSAVASAWQNVLTQTLFSTQVVANAAILQVSKSGSAAQVAPGSILVYTLNYKNAGNQVATSVKLTDVLPSGVTMVDAFPFPTSQAGQQKVWNLAALSPNQSGQVVITTTVGATRGATLHNVADVTGQPGSFPGHAELDTPVPLSYLYLPLVMRH